jgi:hypothetical protein
MAARRASQGITATTYWLIIFVFLFAVSLGLAILFYNQQAKSSEDLAETEQTLSNFVSAGERNSDAVTAVRERARENDRTVVGELLASMRGMKNMVVGNGEAQIAQVRRELREYGVDVDEGRTVTGVLGSVRGELKESKQQVQSLQEQLQKQKDRFQTLQARYEEAQQQRSQRAEALAAKVESLRQDYQSYQEKVQGQQEELQRRLERVREEAEREIRKRDSQLKSLESQLAKREKRIEELRGMLQQETPDVPDQTSQVDGRIIAVNREENLVYINLGRQDHLVMGMTFEVFDSSRGVRVGDDGKMRGKGTIEVVDISESSAACRIVRTDRTRTVLEDDVIANLVYDRDRAFKFYVFGKFDLDGDGRYSVSDHDKVVTLIEEWGGQVVEPEQRLEGLTQALGEDAAEQTLLPLDTDFLVIGQEPPMPKELSRSERDPVKIRRNVQAKKQWERYKNLTDEAKALSVPVLNQNRFLALIGHTSQEN